MSGSIPEMPYEMLTYLSAPCGVCANVRHEFRSFVIPIHLSQCSRSHPLQIPCDSVPVALQLIPIKGQTGSEGIFKIVILKVDSAY